MYLLFSPQTSTECLTYIAIKLTKMSSAHSIFPLWKIAPTNT